MHKKSLWLALAAVTVAVVVASAAGGATYTINTTEQAEVELDFILKMENARRAAATPPQSTLPVNQAGKQILLQNRLAAVIKERYTNERTARENEIRARIAAAPDSRLDAIATAAGN